METICKCGIRKTKYPDNRIENTSQEDMMTKTSPESITNGN